MDDTIDDLLYFQRGLEAAFEVETARTEAEALARLSDQIRPRVDAVLLDLFLPNGQGLALLSRFCRRFPGLPIVSVSGYEFTDRDVIRHGAQTFIFKPQASQESVMVAVAEAIVRHQVRGAFSDMEDAFCELKAEGEHREKRRKEFQEDTIKRLSDSATNK